MEFDWARKKWATHQDPPVAVFLPHPSKGTAAKELQEAANLLLPKTKTGSKQHAIRLSSFHKAVRETWDFIRFFEDQQDLQDRILVRCSFWRGFTFGAAAQKRLPSEAGPVEEPPSSSSFSDAEFGLLGRKPQFDAVHDVVADLALQPTVPSCALLVSGKEEEAGHRAFLQQLLQTSTLLRGRPTRPGRPPHDLYDVSVLIPWVAKMLGLTEHGPVLTLQDLAERIAAELTRQPLGLVLDQIHRLAGGIFAFQQHFWLPLFAHLQESRERFPKRHRLVAIVTDYIGDLDQGADAPWQQIPTDAPLDYRKLILLPRLTNLSDRDVVQWLMEVRGMTEDGSGRLGQIARNVLRNARGEPDPTPVRVFQRLQDESLWLENEEP